MFTTVTGLENVLFGEFRRLQREAEDLFNARGWQAARSSVTRTSFPAVSVNSAPEKVEIFVSAPGIDPKALDISIQQNVLSVSGRRTAQSDEKATRLRQERFTGEFRRVITLPEDVDSGRVEATYTDGIVRITVQRREAPKPRQIEIH